jgi:hypothetical protein
VLVAAGGREVVVGAVGRLGLLVFVVGRAEGAGGGGCGGVVLNSVVTSVVTAVLTGGGAGGGAGSERTTGTLVVATGWGGGLAGPSTGVTGLGQRLNAMAAATAPAATANQGHQ